MNWGAVVTVLLAPLAGAVAWSAEVLRFQLGFGHVQNASEVFGDIDVLVYMVGVGWIYGLVLTILVGLPLGWGISFGLRKLGWEGPYTYPLAGLLVGIALGLPGNAVSYQNIAAAGVTGTILGLGFWHFVRKSRMVESSA